MGWTSYDATNYKINKKGIKVIDKKAECDSLFDDKHKVLKSAVVGNVYYAAIENDDKEVYAIVILISTSRSDGFNFGYKDMSEFCGPYETKCPKSILKLLTMRPAIYIYLSIICVILIVKKLKNKRYYLILLPSILNAISIAPAMPVASTRYLYISFLSLWFIGIITLKILRNDRK